MTLKSPVHEMTKLKNLNDTYRTLSLKNKTYWNSEDTYFCSYLRLRIRIYCIAIS